MILTCPECATGYFVDDGQIPANGRTVRCAACGHRWKAAPDAPLDLVSSEPEGALAKPAPAAEGDDGALTGEDLPRVFRDRAEEEKRLRRAAVAGAAWTLAALALALAAGLLIVFRTGVVRAWPQTASVYAAIGLPVNPTGLVIDQVRAEPSLQNGHAILAVSGVLRNITGHAVVAPPLRVSLFNAHGKRVAGQIDALSNANVPAGQARRFATSIVDPPYSAANLQIDFAFGSKAAAPATAAPAAVSQAGFALRGPTAPTPSFSPTNSLAPANATAAAPASNTQPPGQ